MWKRVQYALLATAMFVFALIGFQWGFAQLSDVRQMDRLPLTELGAVTQGVYAVEGRIDDEGKTIVAPYSSDAVVYFEYKLEEEYRDSDGNRKTRTLDSGTSATPFMLIDSAARILVNPGYRLNGIDWSARQTYRQQRGDRIYTEFTLRHNEQIQMLAWYDYRQARFDLSEMPFGLTPIVTHSTLKTEGGKTQFIASLLISGATGALAIGLAALLVVLKVHRYWVFVSVMTGGLFLALWVIGAVNLKSDWQVAAELYGERAEGALASNQPNALEDLYAHYALIKASANQWPDSLLFKLAEKSAFKPPSIDSRTAQRIESRLVDVADSVYQQQWVVLGIAGLAAIMTLVLIWLALKAIRFKRLVEFIPTSQTTGLAYGISELFGMINVDDSKPHLTSQLNSEKCVAYKYAVEERRGSGKNAKWVTVDSGENSTPFWLEDQVGKVVVDPSGADIRFPEKNISRQGSMRYTEYWLPPFRNIYCLGFAGLPDSEEADRLIIKDSDQFKYLITTQEEEEVVQGEGATGFLLTGLALGLSLVAGTVFLSGQALLTPLDLIQVSLIVPLTLAVITAVLHYNGLVFLKNRVDKTRADIDTLLQRRHDLWPRLLSTVQGYFHHEKKLLAAIAKVRSNRATVIDDPEQAEKTLAFENKVVEAVNVRIEGYPDLKSNLVVQTFQQQMKRTEDELALIRKGYNDSVELYNTQIEKLPDVILAKLFKFKAARFFAKD